VIISFVFFLVLVFISLGFMLMLISIRRAPWDDLRSVHAMACSLIPVMGDINALYVAHKKIGRPLSVTSWQDFFLDVDDCVHCLDIGGSFFTWTNSWDWLNLRDHVWLNRALCSEDWLSHCVTPIPKIRTQVCSPIFLVFFSFLFF